MELIAIYNRTSAATAVVVSGESSAWPDALSASGLAGLANGPVLATGINFPDAMVASSLSAYMHAPIFLVRADGTLTTNTQSLLQNG